MLKLILASPKNEVVRDAVMILREKCADIITDIKPIEYHPYPDCLYETEIYLKKYSKEIWTVCYHPEISYALVPATEQFKKSELCYTTINGIKPAGGEEK